jgi:hypothetical protein
MYRNATKSTDEFFMQRLENLGVSNLNFESSQAKAFQFKNGTKGPAEESVGPIEADAKTLLIHDRIVNNIPNISMNSEGKGIFERLVETLEKGGSSLVDALDVHELKKLMPHHLEFHSTASIKKMGLAKMVNILRSVALGSEQLFGNVFAALMQLVPVYWNLAEAIMMFPLKIPFVYDWWSRKFG